MFDVAEVVDRAGKALLAASNMPTGACSYYLFFAASLRFSRNSAGI